MGKFLSFVLGMIVGGMLTIALLYVAVDANNSDKNVTTEEVNAANSVENNVTEEVKKEPIHYFEVKKGSKYVELHTYMVKDSVALLFGKPDKVETHYNQYSDILHESWIYVNGWEIPEHELEFENGKLMNVMSY